MKTIAIFFLLVPLSLNAQDCEGPFNNITIFQANRIGAGYQPLGNKFFDGSEAAFFVPYTSLHSPSTMFASAPWIGGYINGELRLAGQTYGYNDFHDYYSGPLNDQAEIIPDICHQFDRVWEVSRNDIIHHLEDFNDNHVIDFPLASIFGWPAEGNSFFSTYNGFSLPDDHNGGWADFYDLNQNLIYEPDLGEYPIIRLADKKYIPNQIMWMVFNDQGTHKESTGIPLGVEIQLTVYGFLCTEDNTLNTSLFNSYKIINQSEAAIDSLFFGTWTDYDLGCHEDDFFGSDSTRNTEFSYNQDALDGSPGVDCNQNVPTYAEHPPVQSLTYLSHPMSSYIVINRVHDFKPSEFYNVLNGYWPDGNPITSFETGYNPDSTFSTTKFMFHGDPSDTSQWAQSNFTANPIDGHTISSVNAGHLEKGQSVVIDMVYQFHQDKTVGHLQQINTMQNNVDFLVQHLDSITRGCTFTLLCESDDCVWPGDFNHNGIADHFDLLYWGVMKDSSGAQRDGLINWRGHFADNWSLSLPEGLNAKHGDGNGNGTTDYEDLERNEVHYHFTNHLYQPEFNYPEGPEILLEGGPISATGDIRFFRVKAGIDLHNMSGLAYILEYDTSLFNFNRLLSQWPADSNSLLHVQGIYTDNNPVVTMDNFYAAVQTDHTELTISAGSAFQRNTITSFTLKPGKTVPDSTTFRLRNLIAIDARGNDLHIGANTLVIYKDGITGLNDPVSEPISIYPNPASDRIYLDGPTDIHAQIWNAIGMKVWDDRAGGSIEIDVTGWHPGIYFLKDGKSGSVYRFMKQ